MAKIRVHELAKEMGIPSKQLVDTLQGLGLNIKNHMSTMEDNQVNWVRKKLADASGAAAPRRERAGESPSDRTPVSQPKVQNSDAKQSRDSQPRQQTSPQHKEVLDRPAPPKNRPADRIPPSTGNQHPPRPGQTRDQQPRGDRPPRDAQRSDQQNRDAQFRGQPYKDQSRHQQPRGGQPPRDQQNRFNQPPRDQQNRTNPAPRDQQYRDRNNRNGQPPRDQHPRGPQHQSSAPGRPGPNRPPGGDGRPASQGGRGPGQTRPQSGGGRPPGNRGPASGNPAPSRAPQAAAPSAERARVDQKKKTGTQQNWSNKGKTKELPSRDYSRPSKKTKHKRRKEDQVQELPSVISVPNSITIRDLAEKLHRGPAEVLKRLMDLGTMATINQEIDFETAEILASLYEVTVEHEVSEEALLLEEIVDDEASLKNRPPVVTVMGHVDHGKTSLLDRIRKADVASGEAGGITQHIGAYQVKVKDNRITFIDTPGHEAFTAMRARGANLTDIVILVVAADDGVMPQTVEAVNHIKAAQVPFLVAVNKVDKPDANPERIMQQLTEYNIVSEEWGGDTIFAKVSAKTGEGIDHLLEMVLLLSEMHEIKANPDRPAEGVVIEGELDKGRGAVATVLVQKGTLRVGDYLICGVNLAKVRAMTDYRGRRVDEAYPSMPVEIMGWSDVPEAGERVQVCDEKLAKEITNLRMTERKLEEQKQNSRVSLDDFFNKLQTAEVKDLNLIVKGDVQGSVEALTQSLLRLSTEEVKVSVIHGGVGAISETDVMLASASNAIIIGFNVRPESKARKYAEEEHIDVRLYRVIYEAIEDVKKAMSGLLDPEYKEKFLGRAEVRALFKVPNVGVIAGSYVIDGTIQRNAEVRVLRDGVIIYEGKLSSLKRFKDDVREVAEHYECGIGIKDFNDLKEGDIIEAFVLEEVPRQI